MPTGFTNVTAASLQDASGNKIDNATAWFRPVDNNGKPISFRVGGGGQIISAPVSVAVTSSGFTIQLADTTLTTPANVGYAVTVIDDVTGKELLGPGYGCVQPSGSAWSFDSYTPNVAAQALVLVGPAGPPLLPRGTWASGSTYAIGDVVSESGSSYISLVAGNTGHDPALSPTQWMLLASPAAGLSAAQIAAIADADANITMNFFDEDRVTAVSYIDTSGVLRSYAPGTACAPFRVDAADHFISNIPFQTGVSNWGMAFYDGAGAFLSFVPNPSSSSAGLQTWAVPTGAFFARGWWVTADIASLTLSGRTGIAAAMVVHGSTFPATYSSFGTYPQNVVDSKIAASAATLTTAIAASSAQTGSQLALALSSQLPSTANLFDYLHMSTGGFFIAPGTGAQTAYSDTRFRTTFYTRLQPGSWVANFNFAWSPCYYDQNGAWLADAVPGNTNTVVNSGTVLTAPAGTYYVRGYVTQIAAAGGVSAHIEASPIITSGPGVSGGIVGSIGNDGGSNSFVPPQNMMIVQAATLPPSVVSFFTENLATMAYADAVGNQLALKPLFGSNVMVLGDSIGFYTSWQSYLGSIAGANVSYNCCVAGRYMRDALTGDSGSSIPAVTSADAQAAQYCVLYLATNIDTSSGSLNLGTPADAPSLTASATVSANTRAVIEQLLAWNSKLRIVMPLAYQSANWSGTGVAHGWIGQGGSGVPTTAGLAITKQVNDAIAAVAKLYGIPTLDLYSTLGVCPFNLATLSADGLHLYNGTDTSNPGHTWLGNAIVRGLLQHART